MNLNIERVGTLLLVAAFVAIVARRLKLPYTVGLVLAGVLLAVFPIARNLTLTRDLVFTVLLPPLIFEAAIQMEWKELRRDLPVTLTLATLGVLLAASLTVASIHFLLGWPWQAAVLLGVLISATDPVSVIATFKEAKVVRRLRLLVESESLFNDGTAAVLFTVALAAMAGARLTAATVIGSFLWSFAGGIAAGGVIGALALGIAWRTRDHLVEITLTTIAAYGSFLAAEHFHLSGVMATLTAGILMGNLGSQGVLTDKGRVEVTSFWEYVAFVANSLIFLLIGVRLTHEHLGQIWMPILVIILLVLVGRAIAVYVVCAPFARSRWRVDVSHQHILVWGGLRGALALALVFGVPPSVPLRDTIVTVVFGVVAFSVLVQGLTIGPLLRKLKLVEIPAEQ